MKKYMIAEKFAIGAMIVMTVAILLATITDSSNQPIRPKPRPAGLVMDEFRTQPRVDFDITEHVTCLAYNIYYEARSESVIGQRAVAWTTLNRVAGKHWPDNVCDVVKQRKQFTWYTPGKQYRPANKDALRDAYIAAYAVINEYVRGDDPTSGADHYHADYVRPVWAKSSKQTAKFGVHIFYDLY